VLFFNYLKPRRFGPDERALANILSFYVSAAILSARLLERHLVEQRAKLKVQDALEMIKADLPHFIKNQIGLIKADAKDLLKDKTLELSPEQREMLEHIKNNAQAAIDGIEISISSKNPPAPRWVAVHELMDEATRLMQPSGLAVGIDLNVDIPPDLPKVYVDRLRVSLVFNELIMNAQKAIRSVEWTHGLIEVTARLSKDRDYIEILFANNGPPIPKSEWEDVFKGLRLGPEGTPGEFKGTGLWTARTLLEAQGGNIQILASDQARTTFVVRLPVFQPSV